MDFLFFFNSILLGIGLAMDAFSVSLADGLSEPDMARSRLCTIAGTFGVFQTAMPLIGWFCVCFIASLFNAFQKFIPWIGFLLLLFIGGKMLIEGIQNKTESDTAGTGFGLLLLQGVATSIDALSVGFTISEYHFTKALTASLIIGLVTFVICLAGLQIGRKFGTRLAGKASILGGIILIGIGLEILLSNIL